MPDATREVAITMSYQRHPAEGVPIWEALERWAPEDLWQRYKEIAEHDSPTQVFVYGVARNALEDEAVALRRRIAESMIRRLSSGELIATALAMPLRPTSRRRVIAPELWSRLEFVGRFEEAWYENLRFVDLLIREKTEEMRPMQEAPSTARRDRSGRGPGRPSVMKAIAEEMRRRAAAGEIARSLRHEAEALSEWAEKQFPHERIPKPKSIERSLSRIYRDLKPVKRGGK